MEIDVEDVATIARSTLSTTNVSFKCGRQRISTLLFKIGGPHRTLLEFDFEFTKTRLGMKDTNEPLTIPFNSLQIAMNTFQIPDIIFDPSLLLIPHVYSLGMRLHDEAFTVPGARCSKDLNRLDIRPGCNSLLVPLKAELGDEISSSLPLPSSTLRPWLKRAGEVVGAKLTVRPYFYRYGSGSAFDRNRNVSDSLLNLIMKHADTRTFLKHYLTRRVTADTQAIVRSLAPQGDMMRAACRMSRWIDPQRPWKLTQEQSLSVSSDPKVRKLQARRAGLRGRPSRADDYRRLVQRITNTKQRLRHALLQIRKEWDREQAIRDIQFQLSGGKFEDGVKMKLDSAERLSEHNRLIERILTLSAHTLEAEYRRRNLATDAVAAYCMVKEPVCRPGRPRCESLTAMKDEPDRSSEAVEEAMLSVYNDKRPTICFLCLGDEALPTDDRHIRDDQKPECNVYRITLEHKMHLQSHALSIHGTVS
ncbi:hypothetical protein BDY21DRAFT_417195 [Lineolata rhizophorae]|uniref:Uncharacterized protein n=1 Tax=Lineolata rhizophorae TaxID=578093 RepID=A0A6A6NPH0_9PEZI|nr:hypothetical protein BDY21DRAFT_417195 [Lineolata rhizophorae]